MQYSLKHFKVKEERNDEIFHLCTALTNVSILLQPLRQDDGNWYNIEITLTTWAKRHLKSVSCARQAIVNAAQSACLLDSETSMWN